MSSSHSSFASGTIFGVVVGLLIGHFGLWRSVPGDTSSPVVDGVPIQEPTLPGMSFDLGQKSEKLPYFDENALQPVEQLPAEPAMLPSPEISSPLANAIAMETAEVRTVEATDEPAVVTINTPAEEPQPLDIDDAAPIDGQENAGSSRLRKAINDELSHIPESQREIWFESLKDMSVEDAQGVIRMWKLIGGPIPGLGEEPISPSLDFHLADQHSLDRSQNSVSAPLKVALIQTAISTHQRNLRMKSVYGYRRATPQFHEEVVNGTRTVNKVVEKIDFKIGSFEKTDCLLDLMIDGPGFFEVLGPDNKTYFTRRGRFGLTASRQLAILDPDGDYVLQPEIVLPEDLTELTISYQGEISCGEEQLKQGIQLTRLLSPTQLEYAKNGLMSYQGEKFRATPQTAGTGQLHQGILELSNVNAEQEQQIIEQLQQLVMGVAN